MAAPANAEDGQVFFHRDLDECDLEIVARTVYICGLGRISAIKTRIDIATSGKEHAIDTVLLQPCCDVLRIGAGVAWLDFYKPTTGQSEGHFIGFIDTQFL